LAKDLSVLVTQSRDPCIHNVGAPLRALIVEIINHHHGYLKRELPFIEGSLAHIARTQTDAFCEIAEAMLPAFSRFRRELEAHMRREEVILFPLIEQLERAVASGQTPPRNSFGPLSNAIQFMNEDHDFENKLLDRITEISGGFGGSSSCDVVERLRTMRLDLEEHVRKEDERLFPAAIRLEEGPL
jgi:regulator of cell morphogenesis and NO signaling